MRKDASPFFSVIIPTYNRENTVQRTVSSVLNQSFDDFEVVVVDDGSTDNTEQKLAQVQDRRFCYFKKANGERGAARNFGVQKSAGKYISFLDSDDEMEKNHLKNCFEELKTVYPSWMIHGHKRRIQSNITEVKFNQTLSQICHVSKIAINAVQVSRDVIIENQFDNDSKFVFAEDLFVWLKIGCRHEPYVSSINSVIVNFDSGRSMEHPDLTKMEYSFNRLVCLLREDVCFKSNNGLLRILEVSHKSLLAMYMSHSKSHKSKALRLLIQVFTSRLAEWTRKRNYVTIRNLLFR